MKRFLCLAVAIIATATFAASEAQAQQFGPGFGCGNGAYGSSYRSGFERPPYFSLFPPVYYSDQIVRRPYGVSPFAAPPGITPVEMQAPTAPVTIQNPYFKPKAAQVADKKDSET